MGSIPIVSTRPIDPLPTIGASSSGVRHSGRVCLPRGGVSAAAVSEAFVLVRLTLQRYLMHLVLVQELSAHFEHLTLFLGFVVVAGFPRALQIQ